MNYLLLGRYIAGDIYITQAGSAHKTDFRRSIYHIDRERKQRGRIPGSLGNSFPRDVHIPDSPASLFSRNQTNTLVHYFNSHSPNVIYNGNKNFFSVENDYYFRLWDRERTIYFLPFYPHHPIVNCCHIDNKTD